MNYMLQGSPYNSNENEYDNIEIKKQQRKNKTLRQPVNKDRHINNGRLNVNNGLPINANSEKQISSNAKNMIVVEYIIKIWSVVKKPRMRFNSIFSKLNFIFKQEEVAGYPPVSEQNFIQVTIFQSFFLQDVFF